MEEEKVPAELAAIEARVQAIYKVLSNGFQAMDKIRDAAKKAKQFEELTGKMREAKRLIKDYDVEMTKRELKKDSELRTQLLQKKHALVVEDTMHIGAETAGTLKAQTEQLGRIVNELDTIQFSIKKATQMVREIGKQMATDKCIMAFMFLIVCGVVAIIVVKIVQSRKTATGTSPATAPTPTPTGSRRLLLSILDMEY